MCAICDLFRDFEAIDRIEPSSIDSANAEALDGIKDEAAQLLCGLSRNEEQE